MPLLTGCGTVTEVQLVEVPVPVIQRVPEARTTPIRVPKYPEVVTNGDLERRILVLEELIQRCNADRSWIRGREDAVR